MLFSLIKIVYIICFNVCAEESTSSNACISARYYAVTCTCILSCPRYFVRWLMEAGICSFHLCGCVFIYFGKRDNLVIKYCVYKCYDCKKYVCKHNASPHKAILLWLQFSYECTCKFKTWPRRNIMYCVQRIDTRFVPMMITWLTWTSHAEITTCYCYNTNLQSKMCNLLILFCCVPQWWTRHPYIYIYMCVCVHASPSNKERH